MFKYTDNEGVKTHSKNLFVYYISSKQLIIMLQVELQRENKCKAVFITE